MKVTDMSPRATPNEAVPIANPSASTIIPLRKPKKAKSGAERSRAYRERKRRKGKTAAAPNDQIPSSESVISEGVSLAASAVAETPLTPPPTVTSHDVARHEEAPSRSISRILLLAAALALAGAGIAMNGWFARSLGRPALRP